MRSSEDICGEPCICIDLEPSDRFMSRTPVVLLLERLRLAFS